MSTKENAIIIDSEESRHGYFVFNLLLEGVQFIFFLSLFFLHSVFSEQEENDKEVGEQGEYENEVEEEEEIEENNEEEDENAEHAEERAEEEDEDEDIFAPLWYEEDDDDDENFVPPTRGRKRQNEEEEEEEDNDRSKRRKKGRTISKRELQILIEVVSALKLQQDFAKWFLNPVDLLEYDDYLDNIGYPPMDLSILLTNLENNYYR